MSLRTCIVIPARYDSKRFPGKPIHAMIGGVTLIERVWRIAQSIQRVAGVYVATDDIRIADHVRSFGATPVMTPSDVASGTDRVHAALATLDPDIEAVVNLQGDAPLTPPWVVQALVDEIARDDGPAMVTPAVVLTPEQVQALEEAKQSAPSSGTTVVIGSSGHALYFSKHILPFRRDNYPAPVWRHIGLYAYRRETLSRLVALPPTMLEKAEGLEQLRALESGIPIKVVPVDYRGRTHHSIDHPNDVAIAEAILKHEGEFEDRAASH